MRDFKASLMNKYGLTHEQWLTMMTEQQGLCKVCGDSPPERRSLHVDHCHETGVVRGLLCFLCNSALGAARDDPERLRALARYIEVSRGEHDF